MNRAPRFGLVQDDVLDAVLWMVPIGIISARIYYCLFYWDLYADNPISALYIWEGGLAIYGGIIGGVITLLVVCRVKKFPARTMLDLSAMMAERTLVRVDDVDFFKQNEQAREQYGQILSDIPDYCCVVLNYDTVEFRVNGTMKRLAAVFAEKASVVEFAKQSERDLAAWISRHFRAHGKDISDELCRYLIFLTDGSMAAYLAGKGIPDSRIVEESEASSTRENLLFSQELARQQGIDTARVLIITSDFHLCRAKYIAKTLGMILGVPVFAVIYLLISDAVSSALRRKQRTTVTADYHDIQSVADLEKQEAEAEAPPEPAGKTP